MNKRQVGSRAEEVTCRYLEQQGIQVLQRNYRTPRGELDIIAREGNTLVFVEVKYRKGNNFGAPEEAVGPSKRRQILRVAREYLRHGNTCCRFDVVAVEAEQQQPGKWHIRLIRDAFREDG